MSARVEMLWSALAGVSRFRTRTLDAACGEETAIDGTVVVSADGDALRFTERGVLTTPDGRTLDTRNAITWTRRDGAVAVSHERFGAGNAVALVRLVAVGDALQSEADHICGDDRYACSVRLAGATVEVEWRITGPRKRLAVATAYS